jgi:4-hydroxy-tetrahydrodipicolinate synthase
MTITNGRLTEAASGVYAISATPFTDAGKLDLKSAETLTDFYLDAGVTGLTVLGMMGEAAKLAPEESREFLGLVLDRVAGRVPVVVGASAAGLDNLVSLSHDAMAAGAAGVMVAPLPTLKNDEQIEGYYRQVCAALGPDVPVVVQDFPLVLDVSFSVPLLQRIFETLPQCVMLKHEDWPGLKKLSRIRQGEAAGKRRVSILVGNGGLFLPQEMERGADGAMTGYAYPEMLVEVVNAYSKGGDRAAAEDLFDTHLPVIRFETQPGLGLAVRKEILRRRGAIASAHVRKPGPVLDGLDLDELTQLMNRLDAKLARR